LTEVERLRFAEQLRELRGLIGNAIGWVIVPLFFDGLMLVAAIMIGFGRDHSSLMGRIAAAMVIVIINGVLVCNIVCLAAHRRKRRSLLDALADGTAVVDQIEATAAGCLLWDHWYSPVLVVGTGQLFALPWQLGMPAQCWAPDSENKWRLSASFDLVVTRMHRLYVGCVQHASPSLEPQPLGNINDFIAESARRRELRARLNAEPLFLGELRQMPKALAGLLAGNSSG
jgi:hypothetical protein